mmetsp:Transcript_57581/g.153862  ORF Transcript_57581/g.153862 Transcript_57581/m.153862 type:complete len:426 (-) Transcript_57581:1100-2377(-)
MMATPVNSQDFYPTPVNSQDFDQDSVDVGGGWASTGSEPSGGTVEISLDPELLNTLYRRSRRRLRDIQASCQALLKLDRARSSLRVSGSEEAVRSVRRHLENLSGPCKPLAPAVWAELMRTRTLRYSSRATIAHMQNQSGCRIHIERGRQEVRLFGPKEGIAVAVRLLDEFAETCGEEVVSVGSPTSALSSAKLQALAHAFGITLRVEDQDVVVLGIKAAVADACQELRRYVSDPEGYSVESLPKAPESDGEEHAAEEAWLARARNDPGGAGMAAPAQMGVVTRLKPPAVQPTAPRASSKRDAPAVQTCQRHICPTCGSGRFCAGCGVQIWQVSFLNFMQPAQGMVAAGMPVQPSCEVPARAVAGMAMPFEQRKSSEQDSQMQFSWVPVQQPQMFCASPGGAQAQGQMGIACMVPAGVVPAWCGC